MSKQKIEFNPRDWNSMKKLMDEYGDSEFPFECRNETGESALLTIFPDRIIHTTYQDNGWIRKNIYHREDYIVEELYEKG